MFFEMHKTSDEKKKNQYIYFHFLFFFTVEKKKKKNTYPHYHRSETHIIDLLNPLKELYCYFNY